MTEPNPWNEDGSSIDSYIQESAKNSVKLNGAYYAVPQWTWYGGLWYDVQLFEQENLYIADEEEGQGTFVNASIGSDNFGDLYMINDANSKKSCGRDGIYGTEDDGLPTSLLDFLRLCVIMKSKGIDPITVTGKYIDQIHYLLSAMWSGLAGYEELYASADWQGKITAAVLNADETVKTTGDGMFGTEAPAVTADIAPGIETEEITVIRNDESPYYTDPSSINYREKGHMIYNTAARYYAQAMFYVFERFGLYVDAASDYTHTDVIYRFTASKHLERRRGFLSEASYMYSEGNEVNVFGDYESAYQDYNRVNEIKFFPMPVTLMTPVEPQEDQNAEPYKYGITAIGGDKGGFMVNGVFAEDPEMIAAIKDFYQFMFSKKELANHTVSTGNFMPYNYELTTEQYNSLNGIQKSIWDLKQSAELFTPYPTLSTSEFWLTSPELFSLNTHRCYQISGYKTGGGINGIKNLYAVVRSNTLTAPQLFNFGSLKHGTWTNKINQVAGA